jgi:hypothetical protein
MVSINFVDSISSCKYVGMVSMVYDEMKKLTTKIEFDFENQEDFPEFDVDMKLKDRKKLKNKIIEHKGKKKLIDASTKLF